NANTMESVGDRKVTFNGKTSDGGWLDERRNLDCIDDDMKAAVFEVLIGNDIVPFTDECIQLIANTVRGCLRRYNNMGILVDGSTTLTVPRAASVSTANKADRILPDIKWSGTLAGAVQKVNVVGVVSL